MLPGSAVKCIDSCSVVVLAVHIVSSIYHWLRLGSGSVGLIGLVVGSLAGTIPLWNVAPVRSGVPVRTHALR